MLNLRNKRAIKYTGPTTIINGPLGTMETFEGVFFGIEYFISVPEYQELLMWCDDQHYNFDGRFISMAFKEYWSFQFLKGGQIDMEFINSSFKELVREVKQFIAENCK